MNDVNTEKTIKKEHYMDASVKDLLGKPEVQAALGKYVEVPEIVVPKKLKKPFTSPATNVTTQKVTAISGASVLDAINVDFTLVEQELDVVNAINKKYRIIDYGFALEANMKDSKFQGYSPTGLKLMVTKIEEVKGDARNAQSETKN